MPAPPSSPSRVSPSRSARPRPPRCRAPPSGEASAPFPACCRVSSASDSFMQRSFPPLSRPPPSVFRPGSGLVHPACGCPSTPARSCRADLRRHMPGFSGMMSRLLAVCVSKASSSSPNSSSAPASIAPAQVEPFDTVHRSSPCLVVGPVRAAFSYCPQLSDPDQGACLLPSASSLRPRCINRCATVRVAGHVATVAPLPRPSPRRARSSLASASSSCLAAASRSSSQRPSAFLRLPSCVPSASRRPRARTDLRQFFRFSRDSFRASGHAGGTLSVLPSFRSSATPAAASVSESVCLLTVHSDSLRIARRFVVPSPCSSCPLSIRVWPSWGVVGAVFPFQPRSVGPDWPARLDFRTASHRPIAPDPDLRAHLALRVRARSENGSPVVGRAPRTGSRRIPGMHTTMTSTTFHAGGALPVAAHPLWRSTRAAASSPRPIRPVGA